MTERQNHKPYYKACSECGKDISNRSRNAHTCSDKCRLKRSQRTRRQSGKGHSEGAAILNMIMNDDPTTARVIERELAPVVREALTEDVMHAIHGIVGLLPVAQAALLEDLSSPDKLLRQKAYTLLMRYTVGHGALVPTVDAAPPGLVVNFGAMERPTTQPAPIASPDATAVMGPAIPEATVVEMTCNACGEIKTEFVGKSDRCVECHERLADRARQLEETIKEGVGSGNYNRV